MMLSQPRVLLPWPATACSRPASSAPIHERFRTPVEVDDPDRRSSSASLGRVPAAQRPAELVNIGTLLAFVIVCAAVLVMRRTHPEAERPFRVPFVPLVPILGIATCLLLMFSLPSENWLRLFVWLALGLVIYFGYGRQHSNLARLRAEGR